MLPFLFLALQAGAARVDVAPTSLPVIVNCGFNARLASKITSPLYAKALVLSHTPADALALVIVDSCMMPRELIDKAKERASKRTGIRQDRMLVAATHTHFCDYSPMPTTFRIAPSILAADCARLGEEVRGVRRQPGSGQET